MKGRLLFGASKPSESHRPKDLPLFTPLIVEQRAEGAVAAKTVEVLLLSKSLRVIGFSLLAAGAARAQDSSWTFRVHGAFLNPSGEFRLVEQDWSDGSVETVTANAHRTGGFEVALERRFSNRWGAEFGLLYAPLPLEVNDRIEFRQARTFVVSGTATENVSFVPLTAGLNLHLTPGRRLDLHFGPLIGVALYSDQDFRFGELDTTENVEIQNDFTYGARLRFDVPRGKLSFGGALHYLRTSVRAGGRLSGNELDLNVWILTFGVGYRF